MDIGPTEGTAWYGLPPADVARLLAVDPERGLSAGHVQKRLAEHGANRLASAKKESGFQAFLRQYQDFMQIVLIAAAVIMGRARSRPRSRRASAS